MTPIWILLTFSAGLRTWTYFVMELLEHIGIVSLSYLTVRGMLRKRTQSSSDTDSPSGAASRTRKGRRNRG